MAPTSAWALGTRHKTDQTLMPMGRILVTATPSRAGRDGETARGALCPACRLGTVEPAANEGTVQVLVPW